MEAPRSGHSLTGPTICELTSETRHQHRPHRDCHVRLYRPPPAADRAHAVRDHGDQFRDHPDRARRPGRAGDRGAYRHCGGRHGSDLRRGRGRSGHGRPVRCHRARRHEQVSRRARSRSRTDREAGEGVRLRQAAARALPPHDGPVRALRLRVELFPRRPRGRSGPGQAAGLDLARALDNAARLSDLDSLGHRQGGARRPALRRLDQRGHHRRLRDPQLYLRNPADRALRRRQLSRLVPAAWTCLQRLRRTLPARQDRGLFLAPGVADPGDGGERLRHHHDADQELLPGSDQPALRRHRARQGPDGTARALRSRLPQRHADHHRRPARGLHRDPVHRRAADRGHLLARWARAARLRIPAQAGLSDHLRHALLLHACSASW